jgi:hypothetical protein
MNICERYGASVGIDARNAGKHVFAAKFEWRVDERRPALKFYCDGVAIDDDSGTAQFGGTLSLS